MKITVKTNEDASYRGEPIRKMERALDRAMKKAGFSFVRTTKMGDHQFKKDGKTYSYHIHGQSGDPQYFDYVTVTKGEVGWDKDIEQKSFDGIDGAVAWLSTKTSEKRIAKKYGAKNEGPGAGYFIKLKNVNVDKVWVDSARQYSILKAKFSADWEANHSYWGGEGSADDFEVAIYLDRSLDEFMEWPGAEEEYAQKGSLFDFVKDTCLDDIKNMLNFDCGREGYTYGGGWTTKIPSDGVFEFDNMQFDPDACTVYQYHDKSYVPVSITSEDMMYGIQDAWDEWNNPENPEDESKKSEDASIVDDLLARHNQKWLVKVSYDVDASHSAVAPSIVRADTKDAATNIALKRHRGLGYNMKVVSVEPMTESCKKSEASEQMAINAYADRRFFDPEEFVKYVRKVAGKNGSYLSVDSVVSVDILDKANRLAQKNGFKKSEGIRKEKKWMLVLPSKASVEEESAVLKENGIPFKVQGTTIFIMPSDKYNDVLNRLYGSIIELCDVDVIESHSSEGNKDVSNKSEGLPFGKRFTDAAGHKIELSDWRIKEDDLGYFCGYDKGGKPIFDQDISKSVVFPVDPENYPNDDVSKEMDRLRKMGYTNTRKLQKATHVESKKSEGIASDIRAAKPTVYLVSEAGNDYDYEELFDAFEGEQSYVSVETANKSVELPLAFDRDKNLLLILDDELSGDDAAYAKELVQGFVDGKTSVSSKPLTNDYVCIVDGMDYTATCYVPESKKSEGTDEEAFGKFEDAVKSILMDKYGVVDSHGPSDETANSLVLQYGATLRDAFDKGGDNGYDPTSVALLIITRQLREAPQFFDDCKDFTFNKDSKNSESKKNEKAPYAVWKVKFDSKADAEKEADELHSIYKSIQPYVSGDSIFVKDSARTGEIVRRRYASLAKLLSMDDIDYKRIFKGGKTESKKSESLTLKQAELKKMAKYGEAEDITSISDAEAKELKKSGVELVGISRGIYGMNGALMRGTTDGKLYVITSRNSNLFYFV